MHGWLEKYRTWPTLNRSNNLKSPEANKIVLFHLPLAKIFQLHLVKGLHQIKVILGNYEQKVRETTCFW
jgi:hypothetical protein